VADPEIMKKGGSRAQCLSPVVIYRKQTVRVSYGTRRLTEKILRPTGGAAAVPTAPLSNPPLTL